jgi:antitoxin component YwqK of YwqJK toxin-antitoxin module
MYLRACLIIYCFSKMFCLHSQSDSILSEQIYYHSNGKISSIGFILNGLPEGKWTNFDTLGRVKSFGKRQNNELVGTWFFFNNENCLASQIEYRNNLKNGWFEKFDSNEQLIYRAFYVDDTLQGPYVKFDSSVLVEEGEYVKGKIEGKVIYYSETGVVKEIVNYQKGEVLRSQKFNQRKEGLKDGLWKEKDSKGREQDVFYRHGAAEDQNSNIKFNFKKDYYSNGQLKSIVVIEEDRKEGIATYYDSSGHQLQSSLYKNDTLVAMGHINEMGLKDSLWTFFYPNGKIESRGNFELNERAGRWLFYFESGQIEQKGSFLNNVPHGEWLWYHPSGVLRRHEEFYKGKRQSVLSEYNESGELVIETYFAYNEKQGEQYYFVGDHLERGDMQNGLREGQWIYSYKNGKKEFKGRYKDGLPEGKHIFWYENGKRRDLYPYKKGQLHGLRLEYFPDGRLNHSYRYKKNKLVAIDNEPINGK